MEWGSNAGGGRWQTQRILIGHDPEMYCPNRWQLEYPTGSDETVNTHLFSGHTDS